MTARQVFFGALGFASANELDAVIAEVLGPDVLGPQPAAVLDVLRRSRRDRALVLGVEADMPSSLWHSLVGTLHEIAARAEVGRVAMLYEGDGTETSVAIAGRPTSATPDGPVTRRFLALERPSVTVAHGQDLLEFDVVPRADGTLALDVRDWLGFEGSLFERGEVLWLDTGREIHVWAQPAEPGSCCVLATSRSELVVVVEVLGPRPLAAESGSRADTLGVAVHELAASGDAFEYRRPGWRERAQRTRTIFLAPGAGLVAIH